MSDLTAERLRELLSYDPLTGQFTRIKALQGNAVGPLSGYIDRCGYSILKVDYKNRKAHRLAWLYVHGAWPVNVIDHINGCKTDNRIANLRDVTHAQNSQNQLAPLKNSTTGLRGVHRVRDRFAATIAADGERIQLGRFETAEAAHAAYMAAKRHLHIGSGI